jgi:lipopolysaccharide export system protein LptA
MSALFPSFALAMLLAWQGIQAATPAILPDLTANSALPINLSASSSEFDRRSNQLLFRQLTITQGTLSIRADSASAERLDFENSRWIFRGNVQIDNEGARVFCDDATLTFLGHELRVAVLAGAPARFEQPRAGGQLTRGRAGSIDYDVSGGSLALTRSAWINDGANEVSGDRIVYDLRREYVTAQSGSSGPVVFKIDPPRRKQGSSPRP